jgi:hypothetical protein
MNIMGNRDGQTDGHGAMLGLTLMCLVTCNALQIHRNDADAFEHHSRSFCGTP